MRNLSMCEACGHAKICHDTEGCKYPASAIKEPGSAVEKCGCKLYTKASDSHYHPRVRRRGWTGGVHF